MIKVCVVLFIAVGLVSGLSVVSSAKEKGKDKQGISIISSVKFPSSGKKDEKEVQMADLAKLSLIEAINIALTNAPGKALKARLEVKNGYLIYSIEVIAIDKSMIDLKIDPVNGQVVKKESEKENDENKEGKSENDKEENE